MMVYHQASRDTAYKVAGILSGHAPASKPPAPGLLDEDFLLVCCLFVRLVLTCRLSISALVNQLLYANARNALFLHKMHFSA